VGGREHSQPGAPRPRRAALRSSCFPCSGSYTGAVPRIRRSARVAAAEHYRIAVRIVGSQIDAGANSPLFSSSVPSIVR
jgi:hypothetical protein